MSMAAMPSAGLRRKVRQFCEGGVPRLRTVYLATVAWLISMPSLRSSPWIRGAPQSGLALLICRIRSRISRSTVGRPSGSRTPSPKQAEALAVPLDDGGRLDQPHPPQTAWPQSVEQDPEQAVDREQPQPTRLLAAKNMQLMTQGEVL